jgi:hypothetical protein
MSYYGLELHHLFPSWVLHMAAFATLCEAYMWIDPHFDLWNYFIRIRLPQGSGVEAAILGSVYIYVKSGHGVDPYFHLHMSESMNRWWKV